MRPMKHSRALILLSVALCAGCAQQPLPPENNTLLKSQRLEELADTLANIIIMQEPASKDDATREMITAEIAKAKEALAIEQSIQKSGLSGPLLSAMESVQGNVLLQNGVLYLSSDFYSRPGIDLHLYLTTAVDPRDVAFPDVTAVDLGEIKFPFGPMAFAVQSENLQNMRTAVLWDTKLKRMYGFAQLSVRK